MASLLVTIIDSRIIFILCISFEMTICQDNTHRISTHAHTHHTTHTKKTENQTDSRELPAISLLLPVGNYLESPVASSRELPGTFLLLPVVNYLESSCYFQQGITWNLLVTSSRELPGIFLLLPQEGITWNLVVTSSRELPGIFLCPVGNYLEASCYFQ